MKRQLWTKKYFDVFVNCVQPHVVGYNQGGLMELIRIQEHYIAFHSELLLERLTMQRTICDKHCTA